MSYSYLAMAILLRGKYLYSDIDAGGIKKYLSKVQVL